MAFLGPSVQLENLGSGAFSTYKKDVMKLKAKTDFLTTESACHIMTSHAAFNMSSITEHSGGSSNKTSEELFYINDASSGAELLINLCHAPI